MCYSASASFIASGGLALVGAASFRVATKKERALALIPIFFAIQQALEGIQWLYLNQGLVCRPAGYGFLFFALLLWPIYIPAMVYMFDRTRRSVTRYFVAAGFFLVAWYVFLLLTTPLTVGVVGRHIFYNPPGSFSGALLYIGVICGVTILSSRCAIRWLGVLCFSTALLAVFISLSTAASVWCFFAAVISLSMYAALKYRWVAL